VVHSAAAEVRRASRRPGPPRRGPGEPQPPGHFLDHVEIGRDRRTAETVEFGLRTAERRHDPTLDLADAEVTLVPRATGTVGVDDDLQQRQRIE